MSTADAPTRSFDPANTLGLSLAQLFLRSAAAHPERPAVRLDGEHTSYAQLRERVTTLARALLARRGELGPSTVEGDNPPLTAVLAARSAPCFSGILAALASGHGYVPMLPSFPAARVALMLARSQARAVVLDADGVALLDAVLTELDARGDALPRQFFAPDHAIPAQLRAAHPRHSFVDASELEACAAPIPAERVEATAAVDPEAIAYLLFTSGSTGEPKGVMVAQRNIARFLAVVIERYSLRAGDRFTHLFETTFDLSLFDLFGAWSVGGCLCVPDKKQRLLPHQYILESEISVYFSVPSAAVMLKRVRLLQPGVFPKLRLVLFCGEGLPASLAESFAAAAPEAVVENIYGPTELTLACTAYRWDSARSPAECENDLVPIGEPFPAMRVKVVDADLREVEAGGVGELLMAGPQRALGYWRDPERTAAAFFVPPGETERFYRTGDRVRKASPERPMTFLGRTDSQVKIQGYRVELGEIEAALMREAGLDAAVALAWPPNEDGTGAKAVVAFLAPPPDAALDTNALLDRLDALLPAYMVPKRVELLGAFPLNSNGKIDRKALRARLDA